MLPAALVGLSAATSFGAEDLLQPVTRRTWYHRRITEDAAATAGWSADAAAELAWHAVGVDLYSYHPVWRLAGGPARWRGARWSREALARLHFDNLPTSADIEETWLRVLGGTRVAVDWAARCGDLGAARAAVGAGLHAIQDFYSHSTWIDAPERRTAAWLESRGTPVPAGLSTGAYGPGDGEPPVHGRIALTPRALFRIPDLLGVARRADLDEPGRPARCAGPPPGLRLAGPEGINLDSRWQARQGARARGLDGMDGDEAFDLALALAMRDTRTWLAELDAAAAAGIHHDFWHQVRTGPGTDWTAAYDAPEALPYQFLAAGRPLPQGRGDAGRWFLRIDPTGRGRRAAVVRVRDGAGRLRATARTPGHAITVGPLPDDAASLQVTTAGAPCRVRVHAFRRAPEPVLHLVTDARVRGARSGGAPARGDGCVSAPLPR